MPARLSIVAHYDPGDHDGDHRRNQRMQNFFRQQIGAVSQDKGQGNVDQRVVGVVHQLGK